MEAITSLVTALLVVVVGIALFATVRQPGVGIAVLLTMFGLGQVVARAVFEDPAVLFYSKFVVAIALAMGLFVVWLRTERKVALRLQPIQFLCLGYSAWFFLSMAWSPYEHPGEYVVEFLPYLVLFVLLLPKAEESPDDLRRAFALLVALGGVGTAVLVLHPTWWGEWERLQLAFQGTDSDLLVELNPLSLAELGGVTCIVATLLWAKPRLRIGVLFPIAATGLFVALNAARGESAFALVVAVAAFPFARRFRRPSELLLSALAVASVVFLGWLVLTTAIELPYAQHWRGIASGLDRREYLVVTLLDRFAQRPERWLFGLGGNYSYADPAIGLYPHNHAIQALCETGIVGFFLWFSAPILCARRLAEGWKLVAEDEVARATLVTMAALVVYFLLLGTKRGQAIDYQAFALMAFLERHVSLLRRAGASPRPTPPSGDTEVA